jgi:hypothetical protein
MDHDKNIIHENITADNEHREPEIIHPIVIWVIASILFHLLLMLGVITLKFNALPLSNKLKDKSKDRAILMMDEPKKQIQAKQTVTNPTVKKEEPPKPLPKTRHTDYTMVPGRQGIDLQNLIDAKNLKNLPKPQEQTVEKKAVQPIPEQKEEQIEKKEIKKEETAKSENFIKPIENLPSAVKIMHEHNMQPQQEKLEKKSAQAPTPKQDPYKFVPQEKSPISFKNLDLGFDLSYKTIGNNRNLIQQGITIAAPDEVSLKHLTYYNQCAEMMKNAFATHPQVRHRPYATGKRFRFDLTVDRQGHQLKLTVLVGSGDDLLDKIIKESVESVHMFPKVPSFIDDIPFVMHWTFLH